MYKHVLAPVMCAFLLTTGAAAQDQSEAAAWAIASQSTTSAEVFEFIETYPDGQFAKDAKSLMIDLLWTELAENEPAVASDDGTPQALAAVTFTSPLTDGSADIIGKSIEELIAGSPLFPPIEGLPEELWKAAECSDCHEWERENLCTQANSYLSDAGAENLIKPHPYGGTFKLNLRTWAQGGCE